ncbi:hypothetical protein Tco_0979125, partial [Tanacetum coccineum]
MLTSSLPLLSSISEHEEDEEQVVDE